MRPGPLTLTVVAPGWAPVQETFDVALANSSASFRLRRGKTARIRFVDEEGEKIAAVYVQVTKWRGGMVLYNYRSPGLLDNRIPNRADAHGVYEWTWAPDDPVNYSFSKSGYQDIRDQSLATGEDVITLQRQKAG